MTESDIAELCRRIYYRHKAALDLIFEHRPDLRQETADYLRALVEEEGFVPKYWVKTNMQFTLPEWDAIDILTLGPAWDGHIQTLRFAFGYSPHLYLRLTIGPGPELLRAAIHETALENKKIFRRVNPRITDKYKRIYTRNFMIEKDFHEASLEEVREQVDKEWAQFLKVDLPAIRQVIENEIPWDELRQQLDRQ